MTVSRTDSLVIYNGNGVATVLPFLFRIMLDTDLVVTLTSAAGVIATLVLNTNFTVQGAGGANGGTVTMIVAPATGETVIIRRELPLTQEANYEEGGGFTANGHEAALDRLVMIAQQQAANLERIPKFPYGSAANITLPVPEAGKVLIGNAAEDGYDNAALVAPAMAATGMDVAGIVKNTPAGVLVGGQVIAVTDLPGAQDAAKIGDGTVSTVEFQYLNGVTSEIQEQIDAIIAALDDGQVVLKKSTTMFSGVATGTTEWVFDNTKPQNTEGDQYMAVTFTPKDTPTIATDKLLIEVTMNYTVSAPRNVGIGLFRDSVADALGAAAQATVAADIGTCCSFKCEMVPGSITPIVFKVRAGLVLGGTLTFNGSGGAVWFGGVSASSITISQIAA